MKYTKQLPQRTLAEEQSIDLSFLRNSSGIRSSFITRGSQRPYLNSNTAHVSSNKDMNKRCVLKSDERAA